MAKSDFIAQLRATCDDLTAAFRQVQPSQWHAPLRHDGYTVLDLLNYCTELLEMSGNTYLQSLRDERPLFLGSAMLAEASRHVHSRQGRAPAVCFDDFLAAQQGLLTLMAVSTEDQLRTIRNGRSREGWFAALFTYLHTLQTELCEWLVVQDAGN